LPGDRELPGAERAAHPKDDRVAAIFGHGIENVAPHASPKVGMRMKQR